MGLSRREREQLDRENYIITKSIELFCEFGFENVSMDQVAKASEFTKRTLYRYFQSKEDLYFAAALRGHQLLYNLINEALLRGDTGFEKIRNAFYAYYEYCKSNPALAQFANRRHYGKLQKSEVTSTYFKKFFEVDQLIFNIIRDLYEMGVHDNSICSDDDIDYLTYGTIYTAVSFFHLYSFTGVSFTEHLNLDNEKFVSSFIERTLDQIKPKT